MVAYLPRIADRELAARLRVSGAVLIEGPKACGKTATASRAATSTFQMDEDDAARLQLSLDPAALFANEAPILFDEWQVEPSLWNRIRRQVDERNKPGQFILTGSATPRDDANRHSGAGRFAVIQMRPMSLFESGHSSGAISLQAIMNDEAQPGTGIDLGFAGLLERIVIGGWPQLIGRDEEDARDWLADYLKQVIEVDLPSLGSRPNPIGIGRLLMALGRSVGQAAKVSELAKDVGGEVGPAVVSTIERYSEALERLHLTDNSDAWQPHMRSRTRLRSAPVRYFVDPSLGLAALNIGSKQLRADPLAAGFHFESLVLRDLRIHAQLLRAQVSSWRDANGNAVDAIVTLRGGAWGAFEVKLNPKDVDAAAASLLKFAENVDDSRHGPPAALGVITGSGPGGRRPDGVHVIPITALGP